jgi:YVTN family beta-propeller protein
MSMPSGLPPGPSGGQRGPVQPTRSARMSAWVRRRPIWSALIAIVIVIIAVAVPVVTGALSGTQAETVYIVHQSARSVTPISTITNVAGKPIKAGSGPIAIAVTPDGKTVYVVNTYSDTVTPITTATNTPGKPIKVAKAPYRIAITPNGRTAYVTNYESNTGDADHDGNQHSGQADQGRVPPQRDRDHAGWEDRLCCRRGGSPRLGHGDADHHRDQHGGKADQSRGVAPDHRDDARWEDRLRHRREHSNADHDSDRHAR